MHIGEVVLEVEPAVKSFLAGGNLGDHLVAVGVTGDTLGILIVDRSAIVELA